MTTPSFWPSPVPISLSTSSGTFRGTSCTARAEEWDHITGALECRRACVAVASEVCERSTSTPKRFISSIRVFPRALEEYEIVTYTIQKYTSGRREEESSLVDSHTSPQMHYGRCVLESRSELRGHDTGVEQRWNFPVDDH